MPGRSVPHREPANRRSFLRLGAAGLSGLCLPQIRELESRARARSPERCPEKQRAQAMILVWLGGGPSAIDMWDLKPDAPDGIRGEFRPIATQAGGIQVCEHLPRMAGLMDRCTLVRSLAHTIPDHGLAELFMTTGNRPTPVLEYPSLGSLGTRLSPPTHGVPPFALFRSGDGTGSGNRAGYLGPAYDPFELEVMVVPTNDVRTAEAAVDTRGVVLPPSFRLDQLDHRDALLRRFDKTFDAADRGADLAAALDVFHQQALDILRSSRTRDALDLGREPAEARARYGQTRFGQGCLAARRLVEAGVRFVTVSSSGNVWDTHAQNFDILKTRALPELDQVLSALIGDLDQRGLLDSTIVYCAGEFGRTPRINKRAGRDHWARSMSVLLAGGGFKRGYVHGSTDTQGESPATDPCTPDDMAATIIRQLGIDPHQELQTPTGRPVQLFREGHILASLLE